MVSRTDKGSKPSSREAIEDAARWFVRLQEESASTHTFADWQRWLARSPENRAAYDEIEDTMLRLQRLPVTPALPSQAEMLADTYDGSVPIAEWRNNAQDSRAGSLWWERLAKVRRAAIAAGLAVAMLAGAWLGLQHLSKPEPQEFVYRTAPGQKQVIGLPEGSKVTLDADSALTVRLTPERRVLMLTSGEAYFEVAKDRSRPFIVHAGPTQVTALGTAFNVRLSENRTVVAVVEGKVEVVGTPRRTDPATGRAAAKGDRVDRSPSTPQLSARVSAGEAVFYVDDGNLHVLPAVEASLATAWLEGRRQYLDEPLRYVLADIDRYTSYQIELADDGAGDLRFTGTLNLENSAAWLRGLAIALPVTVTEQPDGTVFVALRSDP